MSLMAPKRESGLFLCFRHENNFTNYSVCVVHANQVSSHGVIANTHKAQFGEDSVFMQHSLLKTNSFLLSIVQA